jgi:hypothetical protein
MITPQEEKNAQDLQFTDSNKEFVGKFILHPDIVDDADYSHIDKNSIITYLKDNAKVTISEVEQLRAYDEGLHVLNNPKNFKTIHVKKLIGYLENTNEKGEIIRKFVYEDKEEQKSRFPVIFHFQKARRYSYVITASARMGFRFNKSRATVIEKSETLQDKTEVKSGLFNFGNKKNEG